MKLTNYFIEPYKAIHKNKIAESFFLSTMRRKFFLGTMRRKSFLGTMRTSEQSLSIIGNY